ncbi:hypothetical protein [Pandoraea communis]|uniref:hypothetical protein n=1 Tax=Pandoraea communis TaxID=2508297 RepID=UPI0025A4DE50|nr:hypothetical protein [Pandoraea communis]MDM8356597.1 hypothetical protein [Pandoraea communis]
MITITWTEFKSYAEAVDCQNCLYLHEWSGKPFYWGHTTTFFGGNVRLSPMGTRRAPRYAASYRHWVEGALRHGARLFIGVPDENSLSRLVDIERHLIIRFPSEGNLKVRRPDNTSGLDAIVHVGSVPNVLKDRRAGATELN